MRGFVAAVVMLAACSGGPVTAVVVDLSVAPGRMAPPTLQVSVFDRTRALARARSYPSPRLPGRLIVLPPDVDQERLAAAIDPSTARVHRPRSASARARSRMAPRMMATRRWSRSSTRAAPPTAPGG